MDWIKILIKGPSSGVLTIRNYDVDLKSILKIILKILVYAREYKR